jgi:hypothetical protein
VHYAGAESPGLLRKKTFMLLAHLDFFCGTLAPFLRASERPMAIACFLLLTVPPLPPLPDFKVPRFLRRIALRTVLLAAFPYLGIIVSSRYTINRGPLCFRWNDSGRSSKRNYVAGLSSRQPVAQARPWASRVGLHELFDQRAGDVADGDVGFLYALRVCRRDIEEEIDFGG